jgi:DNA-binding MarR family transcriptional regulator
VERIEECISFLMSKAAQSIARRAREGLAAHGVTPVQFAALCVLWERDGLSCADLCSRLVLDSATMTGIVDRLESAGSVVRRPDPDGDRRVNRIYLTEEGMSLRRPLNKVMDAINARIGAELGDGEPGLRAALERLNERERAAGSSS